MSHPIGSGRRFTSLNWFVGALFVAAVLSQGKTQVVDGQAIVERAAGTNRFIVRRVDYARRGNIFSADMKPLAQDEDSFELSVDFARTPKSPALFEDLAAASGLPASEFQELALHGVSGRIWRDPMTAVQAQAVTKVKLEWRVDGISVVRSGRRAYGLGDAASGIIGQVRDGRPISGLELSLNSRLAGLDGLTEGLVDRTGAFLPTRQTAAARKAVDGRSVVLTVDSSLQIAAAQAVKTAVEGNKADRGIAIVMDPHTGDVLAIANWPTIDPSHEAPEEKTKYSLDLNPAYQSVLEPGSMFKILTLAKAMDMGVVHENDKVYCKGELQIGNYGRVRCDSHHGVRAHGLVGPEDAIARSCNVSAATWALKIGYSNMVRYIRALGLLEKTGVGVPFEVAGEFNTKEYAKPLQLATLGFGQSITSTPIALASAFCMLANDGVRPTPRLIAKVGDKITPAGAPRRVVSQAAARKVLGYMEAVIDTKEGTGARLRIPGYRLAGKTGTAQKINRRADDKGYVANFVGFVPMPNPRAMILVMVDNPQGGRYYGASVAGPAFVEIARAVIRRFGIPPAQEVWVDPRARAVKPAVIGKK